MARSAFNPSLGPRAGFSLIEVTLAAVIGSSLMAGMIYASQELNTAMAVVFSESVLQGVVRDMGDDVDTRVPIALAQFAQTNGLVGMSMDRFSAPGSCTFLARAPGVLLGTLGFAWSEAGFQLAAAGGHSNPKFTSGSGATPVPTLAPVAPGSLPAYTQAASSNAATMTLGTWRLRFEDQPDDGLGGGRLMYSDVAGIWRPMGAIGMRGMLASANYAYGQWQPPRGAVYTSGSWQVDPAYRDVAFAINAATVPKLVTMTSKLGKSDGVPFYHQAAWAPRTTAWDSPTGSAPGPVPDPSFNVPPPPYFPGGLFPVGVDINALKTAVRGTTTVDAFNPTGPGNIGWLSWDDENSQGYLDGELTAMSTQNFVDHNLAGNTTVKAGSGVSGLPGGKNPDKVIVDGWAAAGRQVTALCYSGVALSGSNLVYTVSAFANFQLTTTSSTGATGSDYLKFLGWSDANGVLMPPGYTPY
ncbi:MAG: hypothetical protein JWM80_4897 [Cyanobacteria bacterium RYN_339]|nr:hypothetical protein [Cyanobacteria bacterium RYN_339]